MDVSEPVAADRSARYRCSACGNITRFDVTEERLTRAFHHYSVGGQLTIESVEVLSTTIHEVSCRWCGNGRSVAELPAELPAQLPAELPAELPDGEPPAELPDGEVVARADVFAESSRDSGGPA